MYEILARCYLGSFDRLQLKALHFRRRLDDLLLLNEEQQFLAGLDDRFVNQYRNLHDVLVAGDLQLFRRSDERHLFMRQRHVAEHLIVRRLH